jgi:hypothetical protein
LSTFRFNTQYAFRFPESGKRFLRVIEKSWCVVAPKLDFRPRINANPTLKPRSL